MTERFEQDPPDVADTVAFWSRRASTPVTPDAARQMVANVSGFFRVLAEWDRKAKMAGAQRAKDEEDR